MLLSSISITLSVHKLSKAISISVTILSDSAVLFLLILATDDLTSEFNTAGHFMHRRFHFCYHGRNFQCINSISVVPFFIMNVPTLDFIHPAKEYAFFPAISLSFCTCLPHLCRAVFQSLQISHYVIDLLLACTDVFV